MFFDLDKVFRNRGGQQTQALAQLYRDLPDAGNKVGVEIGCCCGESSIIAATFLKHVYCIDIWDHKYFGLEADEWGPEQQFDMLSAWYGNITKLKGDSRDFVSRFEKESVDVLYLDAHKSEQAITSDMSNFYPKIKIGGWICGHDYEGLPTNEMVAVLVNKLLRKPDR